MLDYRADFARHGLPAERYSFTEKEVPVQVEVEKVEYRQTAFQISSRGLAVSLALSPSGRLETIKRKLKLLNENKMAENLRRGYA